MEKEVNLDQKSILAVAPHPDDETLGCGGTIAKRVREGYKVEILFMTDGRNALSEMFGIFSDPSPSELVKIRRRESIRATGILGLKEDDLIFLGFTDMSLKKDKVSAQEMVKELIKDRSYSEIYFTSEKDFHPDHQATNSIVKNLMREFGSLCKSYRYIIHFNHITELAMALKIDKRNLRYSNISEYLSLKRAALNEYTSQISIISSMQKKPVLDAIFLRKFLKNNETFFE